MVSTAASTDEAEAQIDRAETFSKWIGEYLRTKGVLEWYTLIIVCQKPKIHKIREIPKLSQEEKQSLANAFLENKAQILEMAEDTSLT